MFVILLSALSEQYRDRVEQLYQEHHRYLFCIALNIVKDKEIAKDIVQNTYIKIIKYIKKIDEMPGDQVEGYLVCIVKNLSMDHFRKHARENTVAYDEAECDKVVDGSSTADSAIVNMQIEQIKSKIKELDEKYAAALILRYTLECTHAEIADMLDITEDNAKARCHRGRKMLIEALRKEAADE